MGEVNLSLWMAALVGVTVGAGCSKTAPQAPAEGPSPQPAPVADPAPERQARAAAVQVAANLPRGLLVAYAQFGVKDGKVVPKPGAARMEILRRKDGKWLTQVVEDPDSNVFHKAMPYRPRRGAAGVLTVAGTRAAVKLWAAESHGNDTRFVARTLWTEDFGGKHSRMRDAEVADLYGTGRLDIAVGTHDQGVVAVLRARDDGGFKVERLDRQADTFIHEIEVGDLDRDGVMEVYATPSEPNRLEGDHAQRGQVVRYVPKKGLGRSVVADLGNRHAKEIYVGDVDGDGRDELYVAVEALTEKDGDSVRIVEGVEIRRYDHDTPANKGHVIARLRDRFCRFLTAGDLDGDGKQELVAAAYRSGLWLLRPGTDPRGEWGIQNLDKESSGFEHAAVVADLDGDKIDELYVASDEQGELRRYVLLRGRPRRQVIHKRALPASMLTWNIMPVPLSLLGG